MTRLHPDTAELPSASVSKIRNEAEPAVPGLPLRTPSPLRDIPPGRLPIADQVYGAVPPFASRRYEYGCPVTPDGSGHAVVTPTAG